ncbi:MAG: dCTP deaminase [Thermoplasmata archaeon]
MMVLSDSQIKRLMDEGELEIKDFKEDNLTPNGYDLTVEEIVVEEGKPQDDRIAVIPASSWFAVSTEEYVKFPSDIAGDLWIRTTWARKGVISSFGMIDAGFEGNLTLSAFNSYKELEIPIGETFAQLVFHPLTEKSERSYSDRSGNYQGQEGVTLE